MKNEDLFIRNERAYKTLMKKENLLPEAKERKLREQVVSFIDVEKGIRKYYCSTIMNYRGKILERVFAVKKKGKKILSKEIIRRLEGNKLILVRDCYFNMFGYGVMWEDTRTNYYKSYYGTAFGVWDLHYHNYFLLPTINLYKNEDLVRLDETLKYCAWSERCGNVIEYVTVYRNYPVAEILAKINKPDLMKNRTFLEAMQDKTFCKYIISAKNIHDIEKEYQVVLTPKDYIYGYKHKIDIRKLAERKVKMLAEASCKKQIDIVLKEYKEIDPTRLLDYFVKYYLKNKKMIGAYCYLDMLNAEKYFCLDLTQDKNIFPHDYDYWHDYYTKRMSEAKNKHNNEKIAEVVGKYKNYEKQFGGYKIILAKSIEDLINEGKQLHHCVGRMGYDEKIAKEESLIFFIRKSEEPEIPYVTMEYCIKDKNIKQLYGEHNSLPDASVKDWVNKRWVPSLD